jgi:hypothetical protein
MDIANHVQSIIPKTDSAVKVYELFRSLGYQKDKILDPTYKRKIDEFEFAKEEREKIKDIFTVFNYDGKLQIFLIETKTLAVKFIRYLAERLSDRYLRFLLILTIDYKEYTFVFPEFELIEEGRHKLKLTKLIFDREHPYHTDLLTISNIALTGDEENWRDIWKRWKDAFSVEKVTDKFFEDYKNAFFELRKTFENQKIPVKSAHELSQQFLNRLMFLYFISKKKWLNNDPKFIKWYWERYKEEKRKGNAKENTFYENYLRILFLEAFNNKYSHPPYHSQDIKKILAVAPYLNGGLFQRNELDELPFHINDSLFEKVLNFFEKYNFTIREDLPLDVEVAVDPQMIGYVYESLSNVAEEIYERQDLGIFYTPSIEVDFMCRRSLVEYFCNHLSSPSPSSPPLKGGEIKKEVSLQEKGLPPSDPSPLVGEGKGEGDHMNKEWIYRLLFLEDEDKKDVEDYITKKNLWYRLEEVLDNLTVVDPACGSGAFLVGMLRVLVELYRIIYSHIRREMTEFELKKKIIGNSLYGVDVMPWATHSAELRLWLQLVIEEDIPYEQRKLFPLLPNLNLRLRVGDSLVQEVGGVSLHIRDSRLSPTLKRKLLALKTEKEKYYNNDPTAKFKSDKSLLHEELRIFGEILDDRIVILQKEIQNLNILKRQEQTEMFGDISKIPTLAKGGKGGFEEQIQTIEQQIDHLQETKRKIQDPEKKPFVWDIDFAEIFGDKGGFDIVIGNPPYVRQEKIAPPNKLKSEVTLEDKREYKDKLLNSIQAHFPFIKKLDKKSDYYIYFYFHGLSLLNDKGTFCFITSNSWLDVGYGKDLQEFLLKYCHIKAIYDNEAKRSFEHADVNTIIALFDSPLSRGVRGVFEIWPALQETARFVMFKRPFEEVINTKNLLAIEKTDTIKKTDTYRVYPIKQETLLEEGWEYPEEESSELEVQSSELKEKTDKSSQPPFTKARRGGITLLKEKFSTGKYEGNKWGGKYLRALDIFFTILEKGKGKLVRLGDIAEVRRGFTTGANEFFYLTPLTSLLVKGGQRGVLKVRNGAGWEGEIEEEFLKPVIKSPRECKSILINPKDLKYKVFMCHKDKKDLKGTNALKYIEWGEKQGFHKRPTCASRQRWWDLGEHLQPTHIWQKSVNDRHIQGQIPFEVFVDQRLYEISCQDKPVTLTVVLNSSLFILIKELCGRVNLGEGALDTAVFEANNQLTVLPQLLSGKSCLKVIYDISRRDVLDIFTELGINPALPIREQKPNPLPDRKALDNIVFDILGLTEDERNEVYWAVCELVKNRLEKARSM